MFNPMDMSGRLVLVTGASSGIGRETAVLLSRLGARLILIARDQGRLDETLATLEGGHHVAETIDLTDVGQIPGRIVELGQRHGKLSGLVHAAGVHLMQPLKLMEPEEFQRVLTINVVAAAQLVKGFRHRSVVANPASVVLLSSVLGLVGQPSISAYGASKGAVAAMTKSLALELARENIRLNCIAPSMVRTPMTDRIFQSLGGELSAGIEKMHPLGLGLPLDIAYAIAFLLAETGRWITGTTLVVDGGYTAH